MPKIAMFAEVEDARSWEEKFRRNGDLFAAQGIKSPLLYSTDPSRNQIAIQFEVEDLAAFQAFAESPEAVESRRADGIREDSVRIMLLDKHLRF